MSLAELDALYAEAVAAIDADDHATAIKALKKIKVRLATTPNFSHAIGGGPQSTTWNQEQIDSLIRICQQELAAAVAGSTGIQQTKIVYQRVDAVEEY